MSEKLTVVTDHVKQLNRRTIATVLAVALVLSLFAGTGWFALPRAAQVDKEITVDEISEYHFSYLTQKEANAFLGFLLNQRHPDDYYFRTDMFLYLIGDLKQDKTREEDARIAFSLFAEECLSQRTTEQVELRNKAAIDICDYLENKYGTDLEYELVKELINEELEHIKNISLDAIAIATETTFEEIEAASKAFDLVVDAAKFLKNPEEAIMEWCDKIQFCWNNFLLSVSSAKADMYNYFQLYVQGVDVYLDWGNNEVSRAILCCTQNAHEMYNELGIAAEMIEETIATEGSIWREILLNWTTPERTKLLKKWACFLAYSQRSMNQDTSTELSEGKYQSLLIKSTEGKEYRLNYKTYQASYSYRKTISVEDLKYYIVDDGVVITGLKAYEGKYNDVAIPEKIEGKPVRTIAKNSFKDTSITSVLIPATVNKIESNAFYNSVLSYIVIMGQDVNIAADAFSWSLSDGKTTYKDVETPIYAYEQSNVKQYAESMSCFEYHSLAWDGNTKWGVDSENNVFNIYTANDLAFIQDVVSHGYDMAGKTINIRANIDLNKQPWYPIGESKIIPFSGSVLGNGKTVSNISAVKAKTSNVAGLFGYVVANETMFSGLTIQGDIPNANVAGGLIGQLAIPSDTTIRLESIVSEVNINSSPGGGIIGSVESNSKTAMLNMYRCAYDGNIYHHGGGGYSGTQIGGLIGAFQNGNLMLNECAVQGTVKGIAYSPTVGGFVGSTKPHSFVVENSECFAYVYSASTNGDSSLGGLVGGWSKDYYDETSEWRFENTYTSSVLDGAYAKGAFVVVFESEGVSIKPIIIKNCYFDASKNPDIPTDRMKAWCMLFAGRNTVKDNVENSGGYTSNQLINDKALYAEWDLEKVWEYAPTGMPKLRWIDYVACTSHSFKREKTEPTCTAKGYTTYTCTKCHYHYDGNYVNANGHNYQYIKTVTPTCTNQGYDLYTCSVCGATERRNAVKALGHTTTYVKTVAPTCTAQGYDECLCSVCGATVKENLVKATGHDNEVVKVVEATCTDNGYTEYKCKTCGTVTKRNNVNAIGHNYTSVRTVNPTCTESGLDTFTCANCGDEYTKEVSALGHNFTWSSNTHFAPTCMSDGYTLQTCSRCSEQQKVNELPATGHDYGDLIGQDYVAAIYNSNKQFVDTMPYTPNSVTKSTIGSTAIGDTEMLLRAGWMTLPREIRLDAKDIKAIEDYSISRQRHPLAFSATVDITAMFAFDGSTGRTPEESALPYTDENGNLYELKDGSMVVCLSKESAQNEEILNADGTVNVKTAIEKGYNLAYSAGLTGTYVDLPDLEWVSGLSGWNTPTDVFHYDGQGKVPTGVYKVDYCFYNESQSGLASTTIKVYDKDSLNFKTAATEETPSQIHHKCIDCGEELLEDIASDSELKIKSASLSLGNNLSMNFKVEKAVLDRFEEPYLEVERNGKLRTVDTYKEDGDYIIFTFNNIAPQTLGDVATATLYAKKDGTLYGSKSVSLSIKDYAYRMLEMYGSEENAKLRTLMVDLLNYGSSAQTYHNYKANDLVNADLTDVQKAWASTKAAEWSNIIDTKYETVTEPIATWKSAALILDNAVTIRYKFAADDISGFTIKLKYGTIEKNYDQRDITDNGDGTYSFKFSGLYAHQMREPVYITIYKNGNAVSNTLRYSVESYAAQVVASTPDSPLRALTDSMMLYGISAANYA